MAHLSVTTPFASNWYFGTVQDGVHDRMQRAGHTIRVHVVPWRPGSTAAAMSAIEADLADEDCLGAVAMGCSPSRDQAERLTSFGKPVVLTSVRSDVLPTVGIDDVAAAEMATRHLISLGHASIVHLTGFTAQAVAADDFSMRVDRARGYSETMTAAGLDDFAQVKPCEFEDLEKVRQAALQLLRSDDRPTAVFAVTDEVAFVVLAAARELGIAVPEELSVLGVDDHPDSAGAGLSTVLQSPWAVGAAAADRVLGDAEDDHHLVALELVARRTTAAPGAAPPSTRRRFFRRR